MSKRASRSKSPALRGRLQDGLPDVDFSKNPYSCDWRADKKKSTAHTIKFWLKAIVLVVQAAAYVVYLKQGCSKLRCSLCLAYGVVFYARVLAQLFLFWERRVPWIEITAEASFIVPLSLASLAWGAVQAEGGESWDLEQVAGLVIFGIGTYFNLVPECQRHVWKQVPANRGKLYTTGWFGKARHINYFGEVFSFIGFALASGQWWNQWIPLLMGIGMALWSRPELDWYLKHRYGRDAYNKWRDEVQHLFIPGVW